MEFCNSMEWDCETETDFVWKIFLSDPSAFNHTTKQRSCLVDFFSFVLLHLVVWNLAIWFRNSWWNEFWCYKLIIFCPLYSQGLVVFVYLSIDNHRSFDPNPFERLQEWNAHWIQIFFCLFCCFWWIIILRFGMRTFWLISYFLSFQIEGLTIL